MRTWATLDRTNWRKGEWDDEPDKAQWQYKGYDCLIVRNRLGALCGYVGLPKNHRLYGKHYGELNVGVHGGLTFSDRCVEGATEEEGICHTNGIADDVWWLGFDCSHYRDKLPMHGSVFDSESEYRNFDYVKKEVEHLADQLI